MGVQMSRVDVKSVDKLYTTWPPLYYYSSDSHYACCAYFKNQRFVEFAEYIRFLGIMRVCDACVSLTKALRPLAPKYNVRSRY